MVTLLISKWLITLNYLYQPMEEISKLRLLKFFFMEFRYIKKVTLFLKATSPDKVDGVPKKVSDL